MDIGRCGQRRTGVLLVSTSDAGLGLGRLASGPPSTVSLNAGTRGSGPPILITIYLHPQICRAWTCHVLATRTIDEGIVSNPYGSFEGPANGWRVFIGGHA